MANEVTSGTLAAALTNEVINGAFDIARSNRTGILSVVNFGQVAQAFDGHKLGWLDFRIDATSATTVGESLAAATSIVVGAGEGAKFRPGMPFSPAGSEEVVLVSSVAADTLTVVRGFGDTVAATIATATLLTIDSSSREENSLAENDGIYQPDKMENFFQTMDTAIEMSRRSLSTLQFGNTNDLQFQVSERIRQLTIQMDRVLVRGRKAAGGLRYYLDQAGAIKTDAAAGALSLDMINNVNAEIVARGGFADTIAVGITKARELNALVSANFASQRLADWSNDAGSLMMLPSDIPLLGTATTIVIDTNLSDDELMIFDKSKISVKPMEANNAQNSGAWNTVDATQKGQDGERVRVIGDFAMEIRQSKTHMGRVYNIG